MSAKGRITMKRGRRLVAIVRGLRSAGPMTSAHIAMAMGVEDARHIWADLDILEKLGRINGERLDVKGRRRVRWSARK